MGDKVTAEQLSKMAGGCTMAQYPDGDRLIDVLIAQVGHRFLASKYALEFVGEVLAGLARVEVLGLISVGDEHEWARLSIAATDRAEAADQCPSKLSDDIKCQLPLSGHGAHTHHFWADSDSRQVHWTDD